MATAKIDVIGQEDLPLFTQLYNQVYRPPHDIEFFKRRFRGRYNTVLMLATLDDLPVGFFAGFELKPLVLFAWLYGVLPEFRRQGIAAQLMDAVHAWAQTHQYAVIRFECHNQHRPMLHLAISQEYDVVGLRWDSDRGQNLVIFEKTLSHESMPER